ncbi:hypothetical protein OAN307_c20840 [Octadecabacter antarcticus 307]|uniref:Peptidase S24/S26A/S26B/S26C domain-containing protein n=1 Tax=Octadecabacter antarcticus 307 TaxID=391626 RepID=M9RBC2_9RHOB|nr:S24 family peptidase [Octadecabacter antarcticus]AGI67716.1 hypothetical protein OAN307_c20840 [Octadecabacter antarcticus 307]
MQDILEIIDEALAGKGLSAAAASRLAVGNPSLIKNMRTETGKPKRFNAQALRQLADVLDLEFYFGEPRTQTIVRLPAGFAERTVEPLATATARQEALEMGFLPIPYHSAAQPNFRGTAPVALARQWLTASELVAESLSFLPVVTDDMVPTLTVGALALLDSSDVEPRGDGIWALALKGRYMFARIQRPSPDMLVLKADKPNHPVQVFKGVELRALKVLGKVVWIAQQPQ